MSDFKKSKKSADSKRSHSDSSGTDLDALCEEIEEADREATEQIEILEIKIQEIEGLEEKLNSVSEKLSGVEGEALEKAKADIQREISEKRAAADECERKLKEIQDDLVEKRSEIAKEIGHRDEALLDIESAQEKCDADLSDAKDAVNEEKEKFEEAQNKIGEVLEKIDEALAGYQTKKFEMLASQANRFLNSSIDNISQTAKNSVAGFMLFTGLVSAILDVNNRVFAAIFPDSTFSTIKEMSNKNEEWASISSSEWLDIDSVMETKREKRRDAANKNRKANSISSK